MESSYILIPVPIRCDLLRQVQGPKLSHDVEAVIICMDCATKKFGIVVLP